MKNFSSNDVRKRQRTPFLILCCSVFTLLIGNSQTQAAAPSRAKPYAESRCNTDPNVFFCEDFEGEDIRNLGNNNCGSTWGNPALQNPDGTTATYCWAGGASYQYDTMALSGFSSNNRVWRISKTTSFTDIVTGINTGTGNGTITGYFKPSLVNGVKEFWARFQVWFSPDHVWPTDLDFKTLFILPRNFIDPPSAPYETGILFSQDTYCGWSFNPPNTNYWDVPVLRYDGNFKGMPKADEFCSPLAPGASTDGVHAPRFVKSRWYTLEYRVKLASDNSGILDLWVDGNQAYHSNRVTCSNGCPDIGYLMVMGWTNAANQKGGYIEIDNIVISKSYIGPPSGAAQPGTPPTQPSSLSVTP